MFLSAVIMSEIFLKARVKTSLLQVRLELTTSASLCRLLSYKYRALTDCATGACVLQTISSVSQGQERSHAPSPQDGAGLLISTAFRHTYALNEQRQAEQRG